MYVSVLWGKRKSAFQIEVLCRFTNASYGFLECDVVYFSEFRINVLSRTSRKNGDSTLRIDTISSDTLAPLYIIILYHIAEGGNIQSTVYFIVAGCFQITSSVGRNTVFLDGCFAEFPSSQSQMLGYYYI